MRSPASFRWFAVFGASILALGGCPGEETPVSDPTIAAFSASADEITEGDAVTLSWQTTEATELALATDVGESIDVTGADVAAGSVAVTPTATTTYTLTAKGAEGSTPASATVTVTVVAPPVPEITGFTADPQTILAGETSTLSWVTADAESVVVTDAAGDVVDLSGAEAAAGSVEVTPTADETYTLTATGRGGEVTATATVTVLALPVVDAFTVTPDTVELPGTEFALSWETTAADRVVITDDLGAILVDSDADLDGTYAVTPALSTTYTLVASGPGGEADPVQVTAAVLPVIEAFTVAPDTVRTGDTVTLAWTTQGGATGAIASGDGFSHDIPTAELAEGSVTATVTGAGPSVDFILTVVSGALEMTDTVTVAVTDAPRIRTFAATPGDVTAASGHPADVVLSWSVDGADALALTSDVGGVVDVSGLPVAAGQVTVAVEATQTFTLTATNGSGENVQTALVTAVAPAAIDAFAALPAVAGAGESVTLSWQTTNAVSVSLDKDLSDLGVDPALVDGTLVDGPLAAEATYTLRAQNALSDEVTRTVAVSVGAPVIVSFGAAATVLQSGNATQLEWEILGGTTLTVRDAAGAAVGTCDTADAATIAMGSCTITPGATETYTLTVTNGSGESVATAEVLVTDGPVVRDLTVPALVTAGHAFAVSWIVDNDAAGAAPTLALTDDLGNVYPLEGADANAGSASVTLVDAGDYVLTLTATTEGTTPHSAGRAVTAVAEPQIVAFAADPAVLDTQGGTVQPSSALSWSTQGAVSLILHAVDAAGAPVEPALFEATTQAEVDAHTYVVSPAASTDYLLRIENAAGELAQASLRVSVDMPEIVTFTGTTAAGTTGTELHVLEGETVTLDWNVVRADRTSFMPATPVMTEIAPVFVDISTSPTATQVAMSGTDDSGQGVVTFGDLAIPFYGKLRESAVVFTEGYLGFDLNQSRSTLNDSFPDTTTPHGGIVAPFWDSLDAEGTGTIWSDIGSDANGRYAVIMWKNYQFPSSTARPADLNFEVFLYEDGRIVFAYGTMTGANAYADGSSASLGFENDTGTLGAEVHPRNTAFDAGLSNRAWSFEFPAQATGTLAVTPTEDTTYMVVGVNDNGANAGQVSVGVWADLTALNPTFTIAPNPAEIGDDVTLTWNVVGASSAQVTLNGQPVTGCTSEAAPGEHRTNGSCEVIDHAEGAFDYVLEFTNPVSAGSRTATLNVYPPLAITSFTTSSGFIAGGESATLSWTATPVASNVVLRANGSDVITTESATGDSYVATLTETTVFDLAVGDANNRWVHDQLTVYVDAANIDSTSVGHTQIPQGETTTIGWTTSNATDGITTSPYTPDIQEITDGYVDISTSSTATEIVMSTETSTSHALVTFPSGFRFPFYGTERTAARVLTSGAIWFDIDDTYPDSTNAFELPYASHPALIAPFWANQRLRHTSETDRGSVWYEVQFNGTQNVLIVQWKDLQFAQDTRNPSSLNYQVLLYEDGAFEFRYETMDAPIDTDTGTSFADGHFITTAGYQNDDGTLGYNLWFSAIGDGKNEDVPMPGGFANRSWRFRHGHGTSDTHHVAPSETTTYEVCATGGGWTDCEDVTVVVIAPGDLLITELMVDPAAVNDDVGEWFELRNVAPYPIDIAGWSVSDGEDTFTVPDTAPWIVEPGQHVVFAKGDATVNGGIDADFVYGAAAPSLSLAQGGDDLTVTYAGLVIDQVVYDTGAGWSITSGASIYLDPSWNLQDAGVNDAFATATEPVWCTSAVAIGTSTDLGSPGTRGAGCRISGTGYQVDMAGASFMDISDTGTELPTVSAGSAYAAVPGGLGFTLPFFNDTHTELYVATNGWLSFVDPTANDNYNGSLPSASEPGALVAAFWDGWSVQTDGSSRVLYERRLVGGQNVVIVQWTDMKPRSTYTGFMTFQAQVWESGDIAVVVHDLRYTDTSSYGLGYIQGDSATIAGMQNADASLGWQYAYNQEVLQVGKVDGFRILYLKE